MKRKPAKEYIIFGLTALIAAICILWTAQIGKTKYYPSEGDDKLQILVFGDSNMYYDFDGETIPEKLAVRMDALVYNYSVGGTAVAKINESNYVDFSFELLSLYNLVKIMECGDAQPLKDFYYEASYNEQGGAAKMEFLTTLDYKEMDYIIIAYGLNDYVSGRQIVAEDPYDVTSYTGALRSSIESLRKMAPEAEIILPSITYCAFFEDGELIGDGYEKAFGGGYINEYKDAAAMVASEYDNVHFMDNLELFGIDKNNFEDYLRDGMHLTELGQEKYTDCLVETITEIESEKND